MEVSVTIEGGVPRILNAGTFHYAYTVATHTGVSRAKYDRLQYEPLLNRLSVGGATLRMENLPLRTRATEKLISLLAILLSPELKNTFLVEIGYDPDAEADIARWRNSERVCPHILETSEFRIYSNGGEIGHQINSFGGSLAARQFAAVTRRFLADPDFAVWGRVRKTQIVAKNEIRARRRLKRASRKRSYMTKQQEVFVAQMRAAVAKLPSRGEQYFSAVKLTQALSVCVRTGRVHSDKPRGVSVQPDSLVLACPKMSGWRRAFLSFVYSTFSPIEGGQGLRSPSTLVICEDSDGLDKFMYECFERHKEFGSSDVRILSTKLPTRADLQCPLTLVTKDNLATLIELGRQRKKEVRALWCSPPLMASWQRVPDNDRCAKVEEEELNDVSLTACEDVLRGFPGETFPVDFVTWKSVLAVGRPEKIRAKVFFRKVETLSIPVPAREFASFLPQEGERTLTTTPVISNPWMCTDHIVALAKSKVSLSVRFAKVEYNQLQKAAYQHLFAPPGVDDDAMTNMELGLFDTETLRAVLGYRYSPAEIEGRIGEEAKAAAERLVEDAPYCDLCKMDDCDVLLECGHWMCKECAREAASQKETCWKCDRPIILEGVFPVSSKSGFPEGSAPLLEMASRSPVLDFVCQQVSENIRVSRAKTKASDEGARICVVTDRAAPQVADYIRKHLSRDRRAEVVHLNSSASADRFLRTRPTVAYSSHMVAVVDITKDSLDPIPASDLILLATPHLNRSDLRRLRDSVGRVGCRNLVELVCVSSSAERKAPPSVEAFLECGV